MILYKLYGMTNKKMVTFPDMVELKGFMDSKGISLDSVVIFKLEFDKGNSFHLRTSVYEEREKGMEFVYVADLWVEEDKYGAYTYTITEDDFHYQPPAVSMNKCLKMYIQAKQEEAAGPYEKTRYHVFDVYSPSELL